MTIIIYSSKGDKLPKNKYAILGKILTELVKRGHLPKAKQVVYLEPNESQQILEKEFKEKSKQEELSPELIGRAKTLAKAISNISFSYRGTSLVAKT